MPGAVVPRTSWQARHFDGRSAESRPAEVRIGAEGLLVVAGGDPARWPFAELVLVRGDRAGEPVQLERRSQPVEVIVVDAPGFLRELRTVLPKGARLRGDGSGLPAAKLLVTIAVVGLALLFAIWRFGIPALADLAAERIPPEWEAGFGRSMVVEFQKAHPPVSSPALRRPALLIQSALAPPAAGATDRFVLLQDELPNAFALPGGHIVLTTGLLEALRSPDELAAVFAHEWGHVQRRHVMRNVFRQASLQLLLAIVAGDQSALSGALRTAGELGRLSYSRAYEREADDEAMALLAAHGTSPRALAEALASIRKASGEKGNTLGFLSTHPAPAERVQRIERAAARMPVHGEPGWRDAAAWGAMKQALVGPR